MITVKIQGGLGNQMFQYAYTKALALRTKQDFCFDVSEYETYFRPFELEVFNIKKNYVTSQNLPRYERFVSFNRYLNYLFILMKKYCKKLNKNHFQEQELNFSEEKLFITHQYIEGLFQSEQYFLDFADEIKKDFIFVQKPSLQNQQTIDMIQSSQSVSVHIRRGDYLKGNNLQYHGICSLEYYQSAIKLMTEKISNPRFFFLSDDIDWVKKNITTGNDDDIYIDYNTGDQNREDMRLMSLCKYNIIANSSFSWWGARLNNNPEKIIVAPLVWFVNKELDCTNIIPDSRIKI